MAERHGTESARGMKRIMIMLCGSGSDRYNVNLTSFLCTAVVEQLRSSVASLTARVSTLEKGCNLASSGPSTQSAAPASSSPAKKETEANEDDDDEDFELFGSDDEVIFTPFVRPEVFAT